MALRRVRYSADAILRKHSKDVLVFDKKLHDLLDDMAQTMYNSGGVGLAAVQVGILKRALVIDVSEEQNQLVEIVNPRILHSEGTQEGKEGCLSIPGYTGLVERPKKTIVRAQDRYGEEFEFVAEEYQCIALNHEIDHLNGILYTDKAIELYEKEDD